MKRPNYTVFHGRATQYFHVHGYEEAWVCYLLNDLKGNIEVLDGFRFSIFPTVQWLLIVVTLRLFRRRWNASSVRYVGHRLVVPEIT